MALTINKTRVKPLPGAIVRSGVLAEAVSAGAALTIDTNGKFVKADANAAGLYRGVGVLVNGTTGDGNTSGDFASGATVAICVGGPIAGIDGMDPLLSVWVSSTVGEMTQTKPSGGGIFASPMGYPLAADVLMVSPQPFDTTY